MPRRTATSDAGQPRRLEARRCDGAAEQRAGGDVRHTQNTTGEDRPSRKLGRGFRSVAIWSRGVDAELFRPGGRDHLALERPIWIYVGRVAVEKNLEAFLRLRLPGTKLVVGDGPDLQSLAARYASARFARAAALEHGWEAATREFLSHLVDARTGLDLAAPAPLDKRKPGGGTGLYEGVG